MGTIRDLRHAVRLLRRNAGFSAAVVVSTALGVGATASIFSLVDAFLLRPLAVPDTARVVRLASATQASATGGLSYPELDDLQARARSISGLAAAQTAGFGLSRARDEQPRVAVGLLVNGGFFSALQVAPVIGRGFTADEDRVPGRDAVVVISYGTWQRDFGGRADAVGRTLRLNGVEFVIVGVAPESFRGVHPFLRPALYVPRMMLREATGSTSTALTDRSIRPLNVFARLAPGASVAQARDEVGRLAADLEREHPETNRGRSVAVYSQVGFRIAEEPDNLTLSWLFFAVAALVLSIACINVANLLLSTAPSRVRETAVRLAMGAGRARLLRQFLIESLLLSTAGTAAGLLIAAASARFIRSIEIATDLPLTLEAHVDLRVVLFAFAVGVASGVLAGLMPAIRATRADLNAILKTTELRVAGSRGWMRRALVVSQVAVALVMLVLSGLFLKSIRVARDADPGFRVQGVSDLGLDPRMARYDLSRTRTFYRGLIERVRALPGVRSAALGQHIPLGVSAARRRSRSTACRRPRPSRRFRSAATSSAPDTFRRSRFRSCAAAVRRGRRGTIAESSDRQRGDGEQVLAGARRDRRDDHHPVALAGTGGDRRRRAHIEDPRRRRAAAAVPLSAPGAERANGDGAVRRGRGRSRRARRCGARRDPRDGSRPADPGCADDGVALRAAGAVRRASDCGSRRRGRRGRPRAQRARALRRRRVSVSRRTREIGIRMAVGASEGRVLRMVLREGVTLTAIGGAAGLALALAMSTVTRSLLNGVNPRDPAVYAGAMAVLLGVTLAAAYVPARRAAGIDPQEALRCE